MTIQNSKWPDYKIKTDSYRLPPFLTLIFNF